MSARYLLPFFALLLLGLAWTSSSGPESDADPAETTQPQGVQEESAASAPQSDGLPWLRDWASTLKRTKPDSFLFLLLVDPARPLALRMARELPGSAELTPLLKRLTPLTIDLSKEPERFAAIFGEPGALGLALVDFKGRTVARAAGYHDAAAAARWLQHSMRWAVPIGRLYERRELEPMEHGQLGELLAFNGCGELSGSHFEQALAAHSGGDVERCWLRACLARLAVLDGDCDGAREHLAEAVAPEPSGEVGGPEQRRRQTLLDHVQLSTGLLRVEESRYSEALAILRELLIGVAAGSSPRALPTGDRELASARCGEILQLSGKSAEALIALREFIDAFPGSVHRTRAEGLRTTLLDPTSGHED